ncbi:hypothetical protein PAMA_010165 [Pampus argenteus]
MTSVVLNELRLEDKLCDVVIQVGDVKFNGHKIVLCSCSSYFRALFTNSWTTSDKQVYNIPGVLPEIMHLIIDYAYTHSVPVKEDNVVALLTAADQFLVPGIVEACCFFLEDQLCLNNCIGIWRLLDFFHCPDMRRKVFFYILHHFQEIVGVSQELVELSLHELAVIIENDRLNVRQENIVFEAILQWIKHLPDQRRGYISTLLSKVRLCFMSTNYLQHGVMDNAIVKDSIECIPIINDAVTAFFDFRRNKPSICNYSTTLTRPRLPPSILLVTGGKDGSTPVTSLRAYDTRADRWCSVGTEEICRTHHGVAVLNNFVYLIGGCNRQRHLDTVQKFDIVTSTWHQVAPMNSCRCYLSVAVLNGCIYAMGGCNRQVYYNTVERYMHETDQWTMVANMCTKRCGASAATLNGKIYICGGFNRHHSLARAECYDPDTNQWTLIARMTKYRTGLGVVAYKDHIYAVGGTNAWTTYLSSAEAYNPQTDMWSPVPSMSKARSYFGIEVVDDQLFVVGGYNGSTTMSSVERYDEEDSMWYDASNIEVSCSGLSCCVLHGLYSVMEKLFSRDAVSPGNMEGAAGASI